VTTLPAILFGLLVSGALLTFLVGLRTYGRAQNMDQDRMYFVSSGPTLEEVEMSRPFRDRVLQPATAALLGYLGRLTPQRNLEKMQHLLEAAGRPNNWTVADVTGLRIVCAIVLALMIFVLFLLGDMRASSRLLLTIVGGALGYYLPLIWLSSRAKQRKKEILFALPDGLDMLNICVGAGLGFDAALSRVGERWQTALAQEFNRVVAEMRLGKPRRQALLAMAERTEVPDIDSFVATIIQADQLGVSIAKVLRSQAEHMRIKRRQRAEELARQATIKLLFPLVFLIFPSMLVVLLGPAVPQLLRTLGEIAP
jgi:tight adherence protein C